MYLRPRLLSKLFISLKPFDIHLPVELWLQIISFIESKRDLFALSHVSNMFRRIVFPSFRSLDLLYLENTGLSRQEQFNDLRIIGVFRQPELATIVTKFDIRIISSPCIDPYRSPVRSAWHCSCNSMQKRVAEALDAMVNLEHLGIHCFLCAGVDKHRYFEDVKARRLQSFSGRCSCAGISHHEREHVLLDPFFTNIRSLRWSHGAWDVVYPRSTDSPFNKVSTLLDLTALVHSGRHSENMILRKRPIQRIYITNLDRRPANFLRALCTFPGSLTHVILDDFSRLKDIISHDQECFVNVRHIGTIPAIPTGPEIEACVVSLTSLHNLQSFDVFVLDGRNPWDIRVLHCLRRSLPRLRKVLVRGDMYCVWSFDERTWNQTLILPFSSWDIIRGACD
ncbi:hypothetical protein M408DRAFT_147273 [Serendipita vermifera MAFF 305830]|uniref:F-box domain-containing protein n=1 Tax=Serendipita vermifera MAFF 305830 TaxID=933852 RepID=A0A0C3ATX4_SERVB|nr:hypothetical protein M408DRAFT_147273 [Serendipita vermifera MAFF 305830]